MLQSAGKCGSDLQMSERDRQHCQSMPEVLRYAFRLRLVMQPLCLTESPTPEGLS